MTVASRFGAYVLAALALAACFVAAPASAAPRRAEMPPPPRGLPASVEAALARGGVPGTDDGRLGR